MTLKIDSVTSAAPTSTLQPTTVTLPQTAERQVGDAAVDSNEVDTNEVEAVARLLAHRRLRRRRGLTVWAWTLASPFAALIILGNLTMGMPPGTLGWTLLCAFALLTARTLNRQATELTLDSAALKVYDEIGKERLGALTEALTWPDRRVRAIARRCLTSRLPTLRTEDARFLSQEQRTGLYRYLNLRNAATEPAFVQAILKALPYVGDHRALPGVERLTRLVGVTRGLRAVRATARATIGLLEQQAEREVIDATVTESAATEPIVVVDATIQTQEAVQPQEAVQSSESMPLESAPVASLIAVSAVDAQFLAFEQERKQVQHPGMRLGFLIASWCVIVPYFAAQAIAQYREGSWPAAILFGAATVGATQLHRLTMTGRHRRLAQRLAQIDDVHGVGRLAEALEWPDAEVRDLVAEALEGLLPRMKASDAALLTPGQRACLYHMLDMANATAYADFLVALLGALQQVGDRNAIPAVERLAEAEPITTRQGRVRQAAVECLPFLHSRAEQNQYSQTLLRASSGADTPSDLLLRSVNSSTANDQSELLRAEP